jgi:hypothetical protein
MEETQRTKGCAIRTEATSSMCPPFDRAPEWGCVCTEGTTTHGDLAALPAAVAPLPSPAAKFAPGEGKRRRPASCCSELSHRAADSQREESPLCGRCDAPRDQETNSQPGSQPPRTVPIQSATATPCVLVLEHVNDNI